MAKAKKNEKKKISAAEVRPYVLRGKLVGFKTLRKDDVPNVTRWFQNVEMITYLTSRGLALSLANEEEWMERNGKNTDANVHFGIFELKTGRHVGNVGLFNFSRYDAAMLGICIGEPRDWNRGFGSEATRLMVEYGFFFLNLYNIRLNVFGFNERGRRAYLRAGFKEVGRIRGGVVLAGKRYDEIIMDIVRDDVDLSRMRKMLRLLEG